MSLALSAGAVALSMALAGCGGGGRSTAGAGDSDGQCEEGYTGTPPNCVRTLAPVTPTTHANHLITSIGQLRTLSGAATADDSALMIASENTGKLGVIATGGNSKTATDNAQKVLDTQADLVKAITDARTRRTAAVAARNGLPADSENRELLSSLIEELDDYIEKAEGVRDDDGSSSLKAEVEIITICGEIDDCKGSNTPDDAADKGKVVADAIYTALTTLAQRPAAGLDFSSVPTAATETMTKPMNGPSDAQGKTWAEIGSDLVDRPVANDDGNVRTAKSMPVGGMEIDDFFTSTSTARPGEDIKTGQQFDADGLAGAHYKGVPGVLFCTGECEVDSDDDLTGDWYFTSDSADKTYVEGDDGDYDAETAGTSYVRYGYWLSVVSATDQTTTINRYLDGPGAQTGAVYGVDSGIDAFKGTTATYKGDAVGVSVAWTTDSRGKETEGSRQSGHFDADVTLTMSFGDSPTLSGMIDNFLGNGVNENWEIELESEDLKGGEVSAGTFVDDGDATAGLWTATAWGGSATQDSEARPAGVYGAFDARFSDGAAAGVYATRKE